MTKEQEDFFTTFDTAFIEFLRHNSGVELPPSSIILDDFIELCPNTNEILKYNKIKFKDCQLNIHLIKLTSSAAYLNGIWIIVSNDHRTIAFHLPLNQGVNIILNAYFEGVDDLLIYHRFADAMLVRNYQHCIYSFFRNPYRKQLFFQPMSFEAFTEALQIIYNISQDILCKTINS